ncbi:MAG: protein kinase [Peptococcaceae bacterium]|jgi:serine/threonine protein kinase|nr:protein kinase [Peptococcaceae bacterium]MDH7523750.1 protein kinase [Peptococcaceae bacterium]
MSNAYSKKLETKNISIKLNILKRGSDISPHKYILLLALITIFKNNPVHENRFSFYELEPIFIKIFNDLFPHYPNYRKMLEYPFYHLQRDGFWYLNIKEEAENLYCQYANSRMTRKRLLETVNYAYMDNKMYNIMIDPIKRNQLEEDIYALLSHVNNQYKYQSANNTNGMVQEGSLFTHEQAAIELINKAATVQNIGRIINNLVLYDIQSNNYYEYDAILVAHSGIYVLELKHWSGKIQIAPYRWIINETQHRNDPHKNNSFKCKILKGLYQHHFRTYPDLWIESVVVLTNHEAIVEGADMPINVVENNLHNPTFASVEDLLIYLKKKESTSLRILDDNKIAAIVTYLKNLQVPKKNIKYTVPGYDTVEYISQKHDFIELLARPIDSRAKSLHRFRVFRPQDNLSETERQRFYKKAYNTLDSVSKISTHPNIHKVWIFKNEDGDIIEGSEWSETGTLRDFIHKNGGNLPLKLVFEICRGIALGLNQAHQADIIHRAVKPDNILILNNIPKLLNFDLAYQIEDNHITVIADSSKLEDDGYIAPEVLDGQDIDEGTDFFGLGIIAYELLTGERPFKTTRSFIAQGGILSERSIARLRNKNVPEETINVIEAMVRGERAQRLKDIERILSAFTSPLENARDIMAVGTINPHLEKGNQHDMYEILELIGEGDKTQLYKAETYPSKLVVIKLFNKEVPRERIYREAEITSSIQSPYIVPCENKIGYWNKERYFLALDYIKGETMRKWIEQKKRPDIETFLTVARCLMEGIASLHKHRDQNGNAKPFLHSDIKPDNIIITPDNKAVLIDFGIAGEPRIDLFQGTVGYIPPDNIRGTDMEYSFDGDLFALGVSLWEWLCGEKPYPQPSVGDQPNPQEITKMPNNNLLKWLVKAVATMKEQRFSTIDEMRDSFNHAFKQESESPLEIPGEVNIEESRKAFTDKAEVSAKPVIETEELIEGVGNPFVSYLNTLSNTSAGNENSTAESQIGNENYERIHVENPITETIFKELFEQNHNVILTGNAGDGKTTIAAEIHKRLTGEFRPLQKREEIADQSLIIIKDMSELEQNERVPVFEEIAANQNKRYLVVTNTGIFINNLDSLKKKFPAYELSNLLKALEAEHPYYIENGNLIVINLGRVNSIDPAIKVFERILHIDNWKKWVSCPVSSQCPIYQNVKLLQENKEIVFERIRLSYRRIYEYGDRLTMRQMIGHLAYAVTGGLNCEAVHDMSEIARAERLNEFKFFNLFFGDDGQTVIPTAKQLNAVQAIQKAGFGRKLVPNMERAIWKSDTTATFFNGISKSIYSTLRNQPNQDRAIRRQIRRLIYFFAPLKDFVGQAYICEFLQSPFLLKYLQLIDKEEFISEFQEEQYRRQILHVLQEYFIGQRLLESKPQNHDLYVTLNLKKGGQSNQLILKRFRSEDFTLKTEVNYSLDKVTSRILVLKYKNSNIEIALDLPFMDYVTQRYKGEVVEELTAGYIDRLEQFKAQLLNDEASDYSPEYLQILQIKADRSFQVLKIRVSDDYLEVL